LPLLVEVEVALGPFLEAWKDPITIPPLDGCFLLPDACLLVYVIGSPRPEAS